MDGGAFLAVATLGALGALSPITWAQPLRQQVIAWSTEMLSAPDGAPDSLTRPPYLRQVAHALLSRPEAMLV
jgi:hypothetical protein